jgi:hypothetical protein
MPQFSQRMGSDPHLNFMLDPDPYKINTIRNTELPVPSMSSY